MDEDLHAYLDGEVELQELPAGVRSRAQAWDRLTAEFRRRGKHDAPPWLETRIRWSLAEEASPGSRLLPDA